jgi:hypothetical protein
MNVGLGSCVLNMPLAVLPTTPAVAPAAAPLPAPQYNAPTAAPVAAPTVPDFAASACYFFTRVRREVGISHAAANVYVLLRLGLADLLQFCVRIEHRPLDAAPG